MIFYLCYVQMFASESRHFGKWVGVAAQGGKGHRFHLRLDFEALPALSAARPAPTGSGTTAWVLLTSGFVVATDSCRHDADTSHFHSILDAERCKTFTVQSKSLTVQCKTFTMQCK